MAHKYAQCIICYQDVHANSLDEVHCLWDDQGWSGRPICYPCFLMLEMLVPEKLDVPIKRIIPEKIGMERWI